jgi:hypothetical protein
MDRKTVQLLQTHTLYRREPALPEAEVERVMRELRLDRMQARNHVRCRIQLKDVEARRWPLVAAAGAADVTDVNRARRASTAPLQLSHQPRSRK